MSYAEEKSSKASTERCLCQEKGTYHKQLSEELFQCCDLDDMMIDKYCKDCES